MLDSVIHYLVLASDWLRSGNYLNDEKEEFTRCLVVADEKLARSGYVELLIRRTIEGNVLDVLTRVEGLELEKEYYDATVSKVKGDNVGLGPLRDQDISAKTAALRERYEDQVKCREVEGDLVRVRA